MANRPPEDTIERSMWINASPETVFTFLTDPAHMTRWMGLDAELDPQPGGAYRVDINGRDVASGRFVEVTPPERVVIAFGWEGDDSPIPPGESTLIFELTPERGGTRLWFRHVGVPPSAYDHQALGWEHYLPRLEAVAAGDNPGPDPWAKVMGQQP